jgi:hypothetical protein
MHAYSMQMHTPKETYDNPDNRPYKGIGRVRLE